MCASMISDGKWRDQLVGDEVEENGDVAGNVRLMHERIGGDPIIEEGTVPVEINGVSNGIVGRCVPRRIEGRRCG